MGGVAPLISMMFKDQLNFYSCQGIVQLKSGKLMMYTYCQKLPAEFMYKSFHERKQMSTTNLTFLCPEQTLIIKYSILSH